MDGIEHFSYSYSCSSSPDEENTTNNDLLNNINFACRDDEYDDYSDDDNYVDDDGVDDDEDDDDEDDDDEETDEGETSSEEGSSFQSNFGYLVNKSILQEANNNRTESCTNNGIQNGIDDVGSSKLQSVGYDHNEITASKLYQDKKVMDLERQVGL